MYYWEGGVYNPNLNESQGNKLFPVFVWLTVSGWLVPSGLKESARQRDILYYILAHFEHRCKYLPSLAPALLLVNSDVFPWRKLWIDCWGHVGRSMGPVCNSKGDLRVECVLQGIGIWDAAMAVTVWQKSRPPPLLSALGICASASFLFYFF